MNVNWFKIGIVAFIALVLQLFFLDSLYLYGYISPIIYISPILIVSFNVNKGLLYFLSFLLGLLVDVFHGTGGIHAAATLLVGALRYPLLMLLLGRNVESTNTIAIYDARAYVIALYVLVLTFIHHFSLFYLDYFRLNAFVEVLIHTFSTLFFSVVVLLLSISLLEKINTKG